MIHILLNESNTGFNCWLDLNKYTTIEELTEDFNIFVFENTDYRDFNRLDYEILTIECAIGVIHKIIQKEADLEKLLKIDHQLESLYDCEFEKVCNMIRTNFSNDLTEILKNIDNY